MQDVLWWTLYQAEGLLLGSRLRKRALQEVMRHVHYEVWQPLCSMHACGLQAPCALSASPSPMSPHNDCTDWPCRT